MPLLRKLTFEPTEYGSSHWGHLAVKIRKQPAAPSSTPGASQPCESSSSNGGEEARSTQQIHSWIIHAIANTQQLVERKGEKKGQEEKMQIPVGTKQGMDKNFTPLGVHSHTHTNIQHRPNYFESIFKKKKKKFHLSSNLFCSLLDPRTYQGDACVITVLAALLLISSPSKARHNNARVVRCHTHPHTNSSTHMYTYKYMCT